MFKKRICTQCLQEKLLIEFPVAKKGKDGIRAACKKCTNDNKRKYYYNNKERVAGWNSRSVNKRIEKCKEYRKRYYQEHKEKYRLMGKIRYAKFSEKIKENVKRWRKNNHEKEVLYSRRKGIKKRQDPIKKLNANISYGIWLSLNGAKKNRHWEDLVGYTIQDLKIHLEKLFSAGMTWNNYGEWHIDHKIPKSVFIFESADDIGFKKCWDLKNLQPLWALDNIKKGNKCEAVCW